MFNTKTALLVLVGLQLSLDRSDASIIESLGPELSAQSWITTNNATAVRWSDWHAPTAGYYVHVAEESDVATVVGLISRQLLRLHCADKTEGQILQRQSH